MPLSFAEPLSLALLEALRHWASTGSIVVVSLFFRQSPGCVTIPVIGRVCTLFFFFTRSSSVVVPLDEPLLFFVLALCLPIMMEIKRLFLRRDHFGKGGARVLLFENGGWIGLSQSVFGFLLNAARLGRGFRFQYLVPDYLSPFLSALLRSSLPRVFPSTNSGVDAFTPIQNGVPSLFFSFAQPSKSAILSEKRRITVGAPAGMSRCFFSFLVHQVTRGFLPPLFSRSP